MVDVAYTIVEHDGGWAYKLGDVFSETFRSRHAAETAASTVAAEQRVPGDAETISWQDDDGTWHEERERGDDRPNAYVEGVELMQPPTRQGRSPTARPDRPAGVPMALRAAADRSDATVRQGARVARQTIAESPLPAVLLAGAVGYLAALMLHGRR